MILTQFCCFFRNSLTPEKEKGKRFWSLFWGCPNKTNNPFRAFRLPLWITGINSAWGVKNIDIRAFYQHVHFIPMVSVGKERRTLFGP